MHALVPPAPRGAPRSDRSTRDQGYLNLRGLVVRFLKGTRVQAKKKKCENVFQNTFEDIFENISRELRGCLRIDENAFEHIFENIS